MKENQPAIRSKDVESAIIEDQTIEYLSDRNNTITIVSSGVMNGKCFKVNVWAPKETPANDIQ